MSVRPIDLQTLFSHLNQVGKDQAHERNAAALQQAQQGQSMVKNAEQADHHINQTEKTEEGLNSVSDEGAQNNPEQKSGKRDKDEEEKKNNFFKDPDLGHNLDIIG